MLGLGPNELRLLIQAGPILVLTSITTMACAWIGYLRTRVKQRECTRRLKAAIDGVPPEHRSGVIEACGHLEASAGEPRSPSRSVPAASRRADTRIPVTPAKPRRSRPKETHAA